MLCWIQFICHVFGRLLTGDTSSNLICSEKQITALLPMSYHLSPFDIGQIKAHMHHGLGGAEISRIIRKDDGRSSWSEQAVQDAMRKLKADPKWRGDRVPGSGAPRKTTKQQDQQIYKEVVGKGQRGDKKITVAYLQQKFLWARQVSIALLEDRLHEMGLKWLRRRRKTKVTKAYLRERVKYCQDVLRKQQASLDRWAYTDGTVFYLDRTQEENEHSQLASLGGWVWRRADGSDAMFQENLAPSAYKKAQGTPVRVWGFLSEGTFYIHVLDQQEVMNQEIYEELIETKFERWMGSSTHLVSDFERCLRTDSSVAALADIDLLLVPGYPRCSQDLNACENCWKILRDRLFETMPTKLETRAAFIVRLKEAVAWMNRARRSQLWYLARNQKERCRECLKLKPPGGRTTW